MVSASLRAGQAKKGELDASQLQAAVAAIAQAMPSLAEIKTPNRVVKKEAFVNGFSIGTSENDSCMCADCQCGASCQCNIGANKDRGVEQAGTCDPCSAFRAEKAAEMARQKKQKQDN